MTSDGFAVDVGQLAASAPIFSDAGARLAAAAAAAASTLDGLGAFWGTTAHGPDFGKVYQPAAATALALAKGCGVLIGGTGDGLQQMAEQYGITESTVHHNFNNIR